ncbi:hypothetical protein Pelo_7900 [Pelomyxa schiedti]|nr:hypothetical protein Pelo_7900 [Pelomyxa schiedti]
MATTPTKAGRALITGPVGVGKTTLIESYCSGCWREYSYEGSLEPCWRKQVTVGSTAVILDLEESYGQEEFSAMREMLFRRANVILICFSVADRDSFVEAIDTFYPMVDRILEEQRLLFLVGLKLDLVGTSGPFVTFQEGISAAIKIQAYGYFQCSSKKYIGLNHLFDEVAKAGLFSTESDTKVSKKSGFFGFFSRKSSNVPKVNRGIVFPISGKIKTQRSLAILPKEVWLYILEYLDFISLIRLSRTCKQLYHLAKTEPIWSNASARPWSYPGLIKEQSWNNTKFSWNPAMCFPDYVPPSPRRSSSPVCFGPNSTIKMSNGKECRMKDIAVGDQVEYHLIGNEMNLYKSFGTIRCIWKCSMPKPTKMVVTKKKTPEGTESILEITLDHPVLQDSLTNKWCMPASILGDPHFFDIDCVYNLVVDSAPSPLQTQSQQQESREPEQPHTEVVQSQPEPQRGGVVVGGHVCCTLGMNVPGLEDSFWGTECVVKWLEKRPDFPNVHTYCAGD